MFVQSQLVIRLLKIWSLGGLSANQIASLVLRTNQKSSSTIDIQANPIQIQKHHQKLSKDFTKRFSAKNESNKNFRHLFFSQVQVQDWVRSFNYLGRDNSFSLLQSISIFGSVGDLLDRRFLFTLNLFIDKIWKDVRLKSNSEWIT